MEIISVNMKNANISRLGYEDIIILAGKPVVSCTGWLNALRIRELMYELGKFLYYYS